MTVSVIIPAHNESQRIASTVCASIQAFREILEVIVVDDGSQDDTPLRAEVAGASVFSVPQRVGKGAALMRGTLESNGDILVFLDADIGETALEIAKLIEPVAVGSADMTVARFPFLQGERPRGFGLVKSTADWGVRKLCKDSVGSILSGQRAARRNTFLGLMPFAPGFGVEVGLTIDGLRQGLRILEVDCKMTHRVTGRDLHGILHRTRQFYWVARAIAARCVN